MSAPEERAALTSRPPSLYSYALRLQHAEPDGWPPERGYALPGPPARKRRFGRSWRETREAVADLLKQLLVDPDAVRAAAEAERRLAAMEPAVRDNQLLFAVRDVVLEDERRARALGRCLTRTGSSPAAVCVGLALLARLGEPADVPCLKALGGLRDLVSPAVYALDTIDRQAAALVWLGHHAKGPELRGLVAALAAEDGIAVRRGLAAVPRDPAVVRPETARRVVEAVRPAGLLEAGEVELPSLSAELTACTGWLLFRATSPHDDRAEILHCSEAVRTYEAFVSYAGALEPTLDHYGLLLSAAFELQSGPSRLHDWGPGRCEALLAELESVLNRPAWQGVLEPGAEPGEGVDRGECRRSDWARRNARRPFRDSVGAVGAVHAEGAVGAVGFVGRAGGVGPNLRIETVVRDPIDSGEIEVRVLIDGRPLVPEAFGRGAANSPEWLLDSGRLRATEEPREVQLAEAYCTEGCCGALHVTIRRDGDEVIWSDLRCPLPPASPLYVREIPEFRFDGAAYDAEISRAENDHAWTWPARETARLIAAGLRDRPDLLTRWKMQLGWAGTDFRDQDRTALCLSYEREDGSPKALMWHIPDDGTLPEARATDALRRLAMVDPRTYGP
ncbi:hypothetical protein ABT025_28515 [Streptomyces sp. NPDC002809]|uniref:hypothetical protein n=1 Tax=Streptomyces sp. NPDC002809 TaxID=3154433 RepID=UPI0033276E17